MVEEERVAHESTKAGMCVYFHTFSYIYILYMYINTVCCERREGEWVIEPYKRDYILHKSPIKETIFCKRLQNIVSFVGLY